MIEWLNDRTSVAKPERIHAFMHSLIGSYRYNYKVLPLFLFLSAFSMLGSAQYMKADSKYIGLKPKTDYNPYESSGTTNVNVLPFTFEYRLEDYRGAQIRPVLELGFGDSTGTKISNIGLSGAYNVYFSDAIRQNFWVKPNAALGLGYTYNRNYKVHVPTLSIEPGVSFLFNPNFLMTVGLNPSLSYFIGKNGKAATGGKTRFKAGWGIFLHFGYNLFSVMY
ncbi:MAG: hypothetical protein JKY42_08330 [Flavobacteriales bacterium]|nr:hypothetical protein [Flavobacteriales bacterium]